MYLILVFFVVVLDLLDELKYMYTSAMANRETFKFSFSNVNG